MSSILTEINDLIQSNLEDIISTPFSENRLKALDSYSRRVEDYLDVLVEMTQALGDEVRRLRSKQNQFIEWATEADNNSKQFAQEGKRCLAQAARDRKRVMELAAEAFKEEADAQNEQFQALLDARLRLDARLTEVAQKRTALLMTPPQPSSIIVPT